LGRGSFTGAVTDRRGKFEAADGGTIFLDEIGDMSLKTQAKVLRALQEQVFEPVGSTQAVKVDVRVIAATNKDLTAAIKTGQFREDLYFRLNVIPIFVPPLRARQVDIRARRELHGHVRPRVRAPAQGNRRGALSLLRRYSWPGNVRELRNLIERLVIMVPGETITAGDLAFLDSDPVATAETTPAEGAPLLPLHEARDRFERDYILRALAQQRGNMSRTADVLGVERSNLYRKMRAFGIAPGKRAEEESSVP
jgi:two-component system nitrogen regulation response regulator NtrX